MEQNNQYMQRPYNNNFGAPADVGMQTRILRRSLQMVEEVETGGVLVDWEETWLKEFEYFTCRRKSAS